MSVICERVRAALSTLCPFRTPSILSAHDVAYRDTIQRRIAFAEGFRAKLSQRCDVTVPHCDVPYWSVSSWAVNQ